MPQLYIVDDGPDVEGVDAAARAVVELHQFFSPASFT